jgi:hypothetical protein
MLHTMWVLVYGACLSDLYILALIKPTRNSVARTTSPPEKPIPVLAMVFAFLVPFNFYMAHYRLEGMVCQ